MEEEDPLSISPSSPSRVRAQQRLSLSRNQRAGGELRSPPSVRPRSIFAPPLTQGDDVRSPPLVPGTARPGEGGQGGLWAEGRHDPFARGARIR
jgi:hypothetical protein